MKFVAFDLRPTSFSVLGRSENQTTARYAKILARILYRQEQNTQNKKKKEACT
ncbi:hypothetical protein HMPREF0083_05772 [Aneurinibacillus aneurinilyticus ATCC 12856]|uniref:Uncharacterized protein n=1 Tax=Aneurinibacillus aneurinilyticus ATCC 12856 TaxID=649747 RepID=U1W9J9_ANEAE|nr:hypothetical protein HMPREF0083_05772 [Aneurinibacillus aneurinilyticus ATCC 12856]